MSQLHQFQVEMTCDGCSNAVKKVLGKIEGQGVNGFEISLEQQTVTVDSTLTADELLAIIKKTGKTCSYIGIKKK